MPHLLEEEPGHTQHNRHLIVHIFANVDDQEVQIRCAKGQMISQLTQTSRASTSVLASLAV